MLSAKIVGLLASRRYQPDAEWEVNILPFGSIFWTDEMPAITDLFDRPDDMAVIHAMFGIRLKMWDGVALDTQDQQLWDSVKRQVPQWALFERLILTDEQRLAREKAVRQVEQEFESIGPEQEGA